MKEAFLHYIWLTRQFDHSQLQLSDGQSFEILSTGKHNTDSGPDFLHARIKIGGTTLVGHVEIHTQASEWYFHGHERDESYRNIILHVVWQEDSAVFDMSGHPLPTLELKERTNPDLIRQYKRLVDSKAQIPCAGLNPGGVKSIFWGIWKERLIIERLQTKLNVISTHSTPKTLDWEEILYQRIAISMGMKVNGPTMEALTRKLPLKTLRKQYGNLSAMQAILFGTAGLLEDRSGDAYMQVLKTEWQFLRKKYTLTPMQAFEWKYARLRPSNFPDIRIMQLGYILSDNEHLLSVLLEDVDYHRFMKLLNTKRQDDYWDHHYRIGMYSEKSKPKNPGKQLIDTIIINAIVPVLFLYAYTQGDLILQDKAIELLQSIPAEKNAIIALWGRLDVSALHAGDSQALIQLKNNYCDKMRCLECSIGHQLIGHRE